VPAATTPPQKRLALSGLAAMPEEDALKLALPLVSDGTVSNEAARAVIAICRRLPDAQAAKAALANVISSGVDDQIRQDAAAALKLIEGRAEYITTWEYAGPYRQKGQNYSKLFDIVFPPEAKDAAGVKWRELPASDDPANPGSMDLLKAMGGEQQVVAYSRASIRSDSEQSATLWVNSDDGVKVWLNGEVVHANNTQRGLTGPPDEVKVMLKAGWNDLLLKVTQNNAGWGFYVRVTGPDGAQIKGLQYAIGSRHGSM
jgi:hypothetical protein